LRGGGNGGARARRHGDRARRLRRGKLGVELFFGPKRHVSFARKKLSSLVIDTSFTLSAFAQLL
jgi:hypothetical protein